MVAAVALILGALALNRWGPPDRGGAVRDRRARDVGRTAERFYDRHRGRGGRSNV